MQKVSEALFCYDLECSRLDSPVGLLSGNWPEYKDTSSRRPCSNGLLLCFCLPSYGRTYRSNPICVFSSCCLCLWEAGQLASCQALFCLRHWEWYDSTPRLSFIDVIRLIHSKNFIERWNKNLFYSESSRNSLKEFRCGQCLLLPLEFSGHHDIWPGCLR